MLTLLAPLLLLYPLIVPNVEKVGYNHYEYSAESKEEHTRLEIAAGFEMYDRRLTPFIDYRLQDGEFSEQDLVEVKQIAEKLTFRTPVMRGKAADTRWIWAIAILLVMTGATVLMLIWHWNNPIKTNSTT